MQSCADNMGMQTQWLFNILFMHYEQIVSPWKVINRLLDSCVLSFVPRGILSFNEVLRIDSTRQQVAEFSHAHLEDLISLNIADNMTLGNSTGIAGPWVVRLRCQDRLFAAHAHQTTLSVYRSSLGDLTADACPRYQNYLSDVSSLDFHESRQSSCSPGYQIPRRMVRLI